MVLCENGSFLDFLRLFGWNLGRDINFFVKSVDLTLEIGYISAIGNLALYQ